MIQSTAHLYLAVIRWGRLRAVSILLENLYGRVFEQRSHVSSITDCRAKERLLTVYRWGRVWYEELCKLMTSKICIIVLSFHYSFKIFPTEKHVYLKQCKVPIFTTIGSLSSHSDDDKVKKPLVLWAKQQLGMCILLLVHLFDVHCTTTMQNLLMQHFVGGVKIRW